MKIKLWEIQHCGCLDMEGSGPWGTLNPPVNPSSAGIIHH